MLKKFFQAFVYSNLFIAGCTVVMTIQTYQLVLKISPDLHFIGFVFFATLCSYSFHWYLTSHSEIPSERIEWVNKYRMVHTVLFVIGIAGTIYFLSFLLNHWLWLGFAAFTTFLYSAPKVPHPYFRALRKVAIGKTIFLAVEWMFVTTVLPFVYSEQNWRVDIILFILSRFFLVYAICILFDYRDRADDRVAGIRSMITYFGEKGITRLFIFSLSVFALSTILMVAYGYRVKSIVLLLVPGCIVALLYNYSRKNFTDMFYYFVLDGLMMLSGLLMLVFGI